MTNSMLCLKDFGAIGDGIADDAVALADALAECKLTGQSLYAGRGVFRIGGRIPDIDFSLTMTGVGRAASLFKRDYAEPDPMRGLFAFTAGSHGSNVSNLGIVATGSSSGGSAISVIATSASSSDFTTFADLYLSADGHDRWGHSTLVIDGSSRSIGARDMSIIGCSVFGAPSAAILLKSTVAATVVGTSTFVAGGTSGKLVVWGTAAVPSVNFGIQGGQFAGAIFSYCDGGTCTARIMGNVVNDIYAKKVIGLGKVDGTVQSNWSNSQWIGA